MEIEYEPKNDFMNIEFLPEEGMSESVELDGVVIDYAKDGRIVAIEILDAGKRTVRNPLKRLGLSIIKEAIPL